MGNVERLLAEIDGNTEQHRQDIEMLKLLLRVAEQCQTRAECGELWLKTCRGGLAEAKQDMAAFQKHAHEMLLGWYIGSVLKTREQEAIHG